jgi:hypothetical protein
VPPAAPFDSFRVLADPYRAVLRTEAPAAGQLRVRHAETRLTWLDRHAFLGRTVLDVEPGGSTALVLHVPTDTSLLHCTVEGVDAALTPKAPMRWELALAQHSLPVRLELVFACMRPHQALWGPEPFEIPRPADLAAVPWLWVVGAPRGRVSGAGLRLLSELELERQRLRDLTAVLVHAADALSRRGGEDAEGWYRTWTARLRDSHLRLLALAERGDESKRSRARFGSKTHSPCG